MSGAETIAGIVLGILPLVVSAVENYDVTFRPFTTYCYFFKELRDFKTSLATQKQLFRNHCLSLLANRIESEDAEEILRERSDQQWITENLSEKERAMDRKLRDYLGQSFEACVSLIELIKRTLDTIQEETKSLGDVASESKPIGDRVWRREIRQKLKFSFSRSRLEGSVTKLREFNGDFLSLMESIDRVVKVEGKTLCITKRGAKESLERFKVVQAASLKLHDALANVWGCSMHGEHCIDICVAEEFGESPNHVPKDKVKERVLFSMTFTPFTVGAQASGGPVWLEIESSLTVTGAQRGGLKRSISPNRLAHDLTRSLRRQVNAVLDESDRGMRAAEQKQEAEKGFALLVTRETTKIGESEDVEMANTGCRTDSPVITNVSSTDLFSQQDLCLRLHQCSQTPPKNASICIGILQKTEMFKYIVYRPPLLPNHPTNPISLEAIISRVAKNKPVSGLTSLERIRLARSLATAILQFYATPWLPDDWRSKDVRFYGIGSDNLQQPPRTLQTPRLSYRFPRSRYGTSITRNNDDDDDDNNNNNNIHLSPIRNSVLFGLGLVLLELAFESPMQSFRRPSDLEPDGKPHEFTDFLVAQRLRNTIGTPLGARYGRIVQRCLDCEFGGVGGHDLGEAGLQEAFFREVVCEFKELESAFRRLDI